ncbi:hypothetical protein J8273_2609 [Carpediemonas membranifera]|uniref:Uncharacterized protein n=1 Tax=Carpediemonas membranifera TaxID=201153 RepID=A0A8J6B174_9EUKA|nr:hypothetical protein J8273_2609 [Carpediemonas membranifera]|eukprot:KAG9396255.1 hypothetical protein J8273_2609 [Carpediemonas membranifera]
MDKSPMTPKGVEATVTAYAVEMEYDMLLNYAVMVDWGILPQVGAGTSDSSIEEDAQLPSTLERLERRLYNLRADMSDKQSRILARYDHCFHDRQGFSNLEPYDLVLKSDRVIASRSNYVPYQREHLFDQHLAELIEKK